MPHRDATVAEATLEQMQITAADFSRQAKLLGVVPFIEFAQLFTDFVAVCADMTSAGDISWLNNWLGDGTNPGTALRETIAKMKKMRELRLAGVRLRSVRHSKDLEVQ